MKERGKPERGKEEQQPARGGPPSRYLTASFRALALTGEKRPAKASGRVRLPELPEPGIKEFNNCGFELHSTFPGSGIGSYVPNDLFILSIYIIHSTEKIIIFYNLTLYSIPKLSDSEFLSDV
jgi:hypothetical protein